jgi:hypothetical protein
LTYLNLRRNTLESSVDATLESRTEWTEPELKKIDIEEITAANSGAAFDGSLTS